MKSLISFLVQIFATAYIYRRDYVLGVEGTSLVHTNKSSDHKIWIIHSRLSIPCEPRLILEHCFSWVSGCRGAGVNQTCERHLLLHMSVQVVTCPCMKWRTYTKRTRYSPIHFSFHNPISAISSWILNKYPLYQAINSPQNWWALFSQLWALSRRWWVLRSVCM